MTEIKKQAEADTALRIEQILKELIACLNAETSALRHNDKQTAQDLLHEKRALMDRYSRLHKELSDTQSDNEETSMDADIKSYLHNTVAEFEMALKENAIIVNSGKAAVGRLLNRILNKARMAAKTNSPSYNRQGELLSQSASTTITPSRMSEVY